MTRWLGILSITVLSALCCHSARCQETVKKKVDVDAIFKKLDTNNDNKLSKDEFLKLAERFKNREQAQKKLTTDFLSFDTSRTGLSLDQFRQYFDTVRSRKNEQP
jgi:hypothetical protein